MTSISACSEIADYLSSLNNTLNMSSNWSESKEIIDSLIKDEKPPTEDEKPPTLDIMGQALLDGYKLGKKVGSGGNAVIWSLTSPAGITDRVIKIQEVSRFEKEEGDDIPLETEIKMATLSGEMGIGPKVFATLLVPLPDGDHHTQYIIQQYVSGPTMDASFPYTGEQVKAALTLYNTLLSKGIIQGDMIASNVIWDNEHKKWYLIDYGMGNFSEGFATWKLIDIKKALGKQGLWLIMSMIGKTRRDEASKEWLSLSSDLQDKIKKQLTDARDEYILSLV